jgi:hypothetical protein
MAPPEPQSLEGWAAGAVTPERYDNRYEERFPEQMPFARTSYHHNWVINLLRVEAGCVAP